MVLEGKAESMHYFLGLQLAFCAAQQQDFKVSNDWVPYGETYKLHPTKKDMERKSWQIKQQESS